MSEQTSTTGKTLYMEGAGMFSDEFGDLGNCRVRTCFADDSGRLIYLEALGLGMSREWRRQHREFDGVPLIGHFDFLHEVTGDHDDCNKKRLNQERSIHFAWNAKTLLDMVNSLGCTFDRVEVLPDLAGYRVHAGYNSYNRGDKFVPDWDKTRMAQEIERDEIQAERDGGEKYPCVSVWRDPDDLNILHISHHRRGYLDRNRTIDLKIATGQ